MTLPELKEEAKRQGYRVAKIPPYDCACCLEYPRKARCLETHEPIPPTKPWQKTHCRRKVAIA